MTLPTDLTDVDESRLSMAGPAQNIEAAFKALVEADETLGAAFDVYAGISGEDKESPCIVCAATNLTDVGEQTGYYNADVRLSIRWPVEGGVEDYDTYCGALHDLLSYPDNESLGEALSALDDVEVYCPAAWINGQGYEYEGDHLRYAINLTAYFAPIAAA